MHREAQTIPPAASNHLTCLKSCVYACNPVSQDAEAGGIHVKTSLGHRKPVQGLTVTWLNMNISPAKGETPCWEQTEP